MGCGRSLYDILPSWFAPNIKDPRLLAELRRLDITLVVGDEDPFVANNREFVAVLAAKGVPHRLIARYGRAHRFRFWRQMVRLHL